MTTSQRRKWNEMGGKMGGKAPAGSCNDHPGSARVETVENCSLIRNDNATVGMKTVAAEPGVN